MPSADRLVALTWHQRSAPLETRERLLGTLEGGPDRALLATCHRVELYAAVEADAAAADWSASLDLVADDRHAMTVHDGAPAVAHLFAVAAGLDSAVVGEPQILSQVRRACASASHALLIAAFGRALHVGRTVRAEAGLSSARSVGSLAVDALLSRIKSPAGATVLVIGAGEMGKLALRALARRTGCVVVANRDVARASALAAEYGATAIGLDALPGSLAAAAGVISAADTRGALLRSDVVGERLGRGPLVVVDVAVPRSVDAETRALLGEGYLSVDDLPGARAAAPESTLRAAHERCLAEAERFVRERAPERAQAIRALRERADRVRAARLARAMRQLGHLSSRDRRIVEMLSSSITNALMHAPTVALRDRDAAGGHG